MSRSVRVHSYTYQEFDTANEPDFLAFFNLFNSGTDLSGYQIGDTIQDTATGMAFSIMTQAGVKFWAPRGGSVLRVSSTSTFEGQTFVKMDGTTPLKVIAPSAVGGFSSGIMLGKKIAGAGIGYLQTIGNAWVKLVGAPLTTSQPTTTDNGATGGLAQDAVATNVSICTPLLNGVTIGASGNYALVRLSGASLV